ncbi:hypothetical protein N0V90_004528 [Kalmusia sp. IMI 367209]|nr:hypothetical protein N0V90_004528 [Kalmusia sp. IMI 367209]
MHGIRWFLSFFAPLLKVLEDIGPRRQREQGSLSAELRAAPSAVDASCAMDDVNDGDSDVTSLGATTELIVTVFFQNV